MNVLTMAFWVSAALLFYSYAGYGLLLYVLIQCKKLFALSAPQYNPAAFAWPSVSLVIAALNEEAVIERKIINTLELDYPPEKLNVIIITDGSSDKTPQIVNEYQRINLLHQPERKGKTAAINRAIRFVEQEITVFSDANTLLNRDCLKEMAKHYTDPRVGGVAGEKKVVAHAGAKAATAMEGLYWKYESLLKKLDAGFYSVVGAAGELFSIRTSLYEPLKEGTIIEDFVLSLRICIKGYIIKYEPDAYAIETASVSMRQEQERKVRICAGAFQAMGMVRELFNVFRYPSLSFQFISHRILRWTLCPVCLVLLFVSNLFLFSSHLFFVYTGISQLVFYGLAVTGWVLAKYNVSITMLYVPYYFLFMNIAVFQGFNRFVRKKQSVLWEKTFRDK